MDTELTNMADSQDPLEFSNPSRFQRTRAQISNKYRHARDHAKIKYHQASEHAGHLYDRGKGDRNVVYMFGPMASAVAAAGIFSVATSTSVFFSQKLNREETDLTFHYNLHTRNAVRTYQVLNIILAILSGVAMSILIISSFTRFMKNPLAKIEQTGDYSDCLHEGGGKAFCALNNTMTRRLEVATMMIIMLFTLVLGIMNIVYLEHHRRRENEGVIENDTSLNIIGLIVANALMIAFSGVIVAYYLYILFTVKKTNVLSGVFSSSNMTSLKHKFGRHSKPSSTYDHFDYQPLSVSQDPNTASRCADLISSLSGS